MFVPFGQITLFQTMFVSSFTIGTYGSAQFYVQTNSLGIIVLRKSEIHHDQNTDYVQDKPLGTPIESIVSNE